MSIWNDPPHVNVPAGFKEELGIPNLVAELLIRRGFITLASARSFLDPACYKPSPPEAMPGVTSAIEELNTAIKENIPILVWGDFDVDGQTATTILVSALQKLGAHVNYHIPVREKESHGINIPNLQAYTDQHGLLLTCDTGISAHQAIHFARQKGLTTIITDHHDLPPSLPQADVILSSKFLPKEHPLAALPGVGVAYKLIEGLFAFHGFDTSEFLDLVALGIVADVAELVNDTRYLLQLGLYQLKNTRRPGLQALLEQAELNPASLTSEHIGFGIAPRLNAVGRLSDANWIVEFLTTQNLTKARLMAQELESLNARRKLLTDQVFEGAMSQIERNPTRAGEAVLVLEHPDWPGGVIGIVASRLVDFYHKPVILISVAPDGTGRGSARSVPGVNISQAIASQSELLIGYGGHPMAGGFAIHQDKIESFRNGLIRNIQEQIQLTSITPQLQIDTWIELDALTTDFAEAVHKLSPFGAGNPAVVLATPRLQIVDSRKIGRYDEHMNITITSTKGNLKNVIWWQGSGYKLPESPFDLAYSIHPTNFQGQPKVEISWLEAREITSEMSTHPQRAYDLVDCRQVIRPELELKKYINDPESLIWCEAQPCPGGNCVDRTKITNVHTLLIWSAPPGRQELLQALEQARPEKIVVFSNQLELDEIASFLRRIAGMVKYIINHSGGRGSIVALAAATSQRIITVKTALQWLCATGELSLSLVEPDGFIAQFGDRLRQAHAKNLEAELRILLTETAAFRNYFHHGDLNQLVY